jgi:hypothetical protein
VRRIGRQPVLLAASAVLGVGFITAGSGPAAGAVAAMSQPRPGSALSPNPAAKNALLGVSADSATDAWAVGWYLNESTNLQVPLILRWNGTAWSQVPAVGNFGHPMDFTPNPTQALHWNGATWSRVNSPSPSAGDNELNAVTALSPTDAWAVGEFDNTNGRTSTLILHWNGTTWSRT